MPSILLVVVIELIKIIIVLNLIITGMPSILQSLKGDIPAELEF